MLKYDPIAYLNSLQGRGWDMGLSRITSLLESLQNPQNSFSSVHVAGTNGKGTTCAVLESVFRQSGYRTGLYTSPHLHRVHERIQVDGKAISATDLSATIVRMRPLLDDLNCTYFEALTAIAFIHFAETNVEIAMVEVGLGGRFDATNVLTPALSIISAIGLDHTEQLGNSLRDIAREKAAILKPGVPCLLQRQEPVVLNEIAEVASTKGVKPELVEDICQTADISLAESGSIFKLNIGPGQMLEIDLPLSGKPQVENAVLAVAATQMLARRQFRVPLAAIVAGLRTVTWPGRLQKLADSPKVVVDVAHNAPAFKALAASLERIHSYKDLHFILGLLADKDAAAIAAIVASCSDFVHLVTPLADRALAGRTLAKYFSGHAKKPYLYPEQLQGFASALGSASAGDLVCVAGSHYVVGDFIDYFAKNRKILDKDQIIS